MTIEKEPSLNLYLKTKIGKHQITILKCST